MSNASDFEIRNGYLERYLGKDEIVVIPENVTWVCCSAFNSNHFVKKIVFGDSVSHIDASAFCGSIHVEAYDVSANNVRYCSAGGIVFSKDMKELVAFPGGRGGEYAVPEGVEKIRAYAFCGNPWLTAVHFPESLLTIDTGAFHKCDNIKSFYIPKNVVDMDCSAVFGKKTESITVNQENKKFASKDGMVFSAKYKTIQYCPRTKTGEVILPDTVYGINALAFCNCSQITKVHLPSKATKIGSMAFGNCSSITEITIPKSVTAINNNAFTNCTALKEISLPERIKVVSESAFENCKNLSKVTLPDELLAIEAKAFNGCDSLKEIILPFHVCKLGAEAFSGGTAVFCSAEIFKKLPTPTKKTTCIKYLEGTDRFSEKLSETIIAHIKKNKEIFFEALIKEGNISALRNCLALFKPTKAITEECLTLSGRYNKPEINFLLLDNINKKPAPSAKKETADQAKEASAENTEKFILNPKEAKKIFKFSETPDGIIINGYKGNETKIIIPDQIGEYLVVEIKASAFEGMDTIAKVCIPDSVSKLGAKAFSNCDNLESVVLPSKLVAIEKYTFYGCPMLNTISIPDNVKKIGESAFSGCTGLADEKGFVIIKSRLYGYYGTSNVVSVPDTVTEIESFAFRNQADITEIKLPKGLKKIGYRAFQGCIGVTTIDLPSGLSTIGGGVFAECQGLKKITIPSRVKKLEGFTFAGCTNLEIVHMGSGLAAMNTIGEPDFLMCENLTIHAPAGSYAEQYAKENNIPFVAE